MKKLTTDQLLEKLLKEYSIYQMQGSDRIIIRAKGGPVKSTSTDRPASKSRMNAVEFGGVLKAVNKIGKLIAGLKHLSDYCNGGLLKLFAFSLLCPGLSRASRPRRFRRLSRAPTSDARMRAGRTGRRPSAR